MYFYFFCTEWKNVLNHDHHHCYSSLFLQAAKCSSSSVLNVAAVEGFLWWCVIEVNGYTHKRKLILDYAHH